MKIKSRIFVLLGIFVAIYALLLLVPAPDQEVLDRYNLTPNGLKMLNLTIIIPIAAIWYAAIYGYSKLDNYQRMISKSKDGRQIAKLKKGVLLLALSLPVSAIINEILELIARNNPSSEAATIVIGNYEALILPLIAFSYISAGARGLADISKSRPPQRILNSIVGGSILLGLGYTYLISKAPGTIADTHHLSIGAFLFTLIAPYTFMWFLGLFAAYEVYYYSRKVSGTVYRESWRMVATGLVAIIVFSILLQYLGTISKQLEDLSLPGILALVYLILLLWGGSYMLLASGTKRLMKIEEA